MNILFWNLNKNNNIAHIEKCLEENHVDIALFAEFDNNDFSKICVPNYSHFEGYGGCYHITVVKKSDIYLDMLRESSRYTIMKLVKNDKPYILVGIHLEDKISGDKDTVLYNIGCIVRDIEDFENEIACENTIVIGDFNANPYEKELVSVYGFNAVLFKDIINREKIRKYNKRKYKRFYNPTINFIEESGKNYGSYYYNKGSYTPIWNCLDQAIVRADLVNKIEKYSYLKKIDKTPLIKTTKPNASISDHLPLLIKINES